MAEMDDITRDALRRASHMQSRAPRQTKTPPAQPKEPEQKAKPIEKTIEKPKKTQPDKGLLGTLFKEQDKSIILMLLVLLMGEDVEPSLLIALVYLLL